MTEKEEEYELEQVKGNSSHEEGSTGSGIDKQREDYLDIINIIESLMKNEDYPLKNESIITISKILSFLNKEIHDDKNFTEAWLIKGTVLYKTGRYNGAIDAFDGALESMPREVSEGKVEMWKEKNGINYRYALKFKAFAFCKLGRYREALNALYEITAIYPEDPEIESHKNMLRTLENERLTRGKNIAPESYPENSSTRESRSESPSELEKFEGALKNFDMDLESNPKDADIWRNKGFVLYVLGRYEEALEAFNNSLDIDPKNAYAWGFKGTTLYMLGRSEEALKSLDKALQKNPNIFEAWFNKGSILFELGRYKQALSAVENALRINAKDVNALNLKTSILFKLEMDEE